MKYYKEVARNPSPMNDAACQTAVDQGNEKKIDSYFYEGDN